MIMVTITEYDLGKSALQLLEYIKSHPDIDINSLCERFGPSTTAALEYLVKYDFLARPVYQRAPEVLYWNKYHLTPKGFAVLEKVSTDAEMREAEKASRRGDWVRWVIDAILVLVTALITWFAAKS